VLRDVTVLDAEDVVNSHAIRLPVGSTPRRNGSVEARCVPVIVAASATRSPSATICSSV
jgi:hypothetical protein